MINFNTHDILQDFCDILQTRKHLIKLVLERA